jgi:hypothetical protein
MYYVGFEPTIPASERAKAVYALDAAANVIGTVQSYCYQIKNKMYGDMRR